jgi:hypothetical protein
MVARAIKEVAESTVQRSDTFTVVKKKRFGLNSSDHIADGIDTTIAGAAPNNNYESATTLSVGQVSSAEAKVIFRFDQLAAKAARRRCISATLNIYVSSVAGDGVQGNLLTYIVLRDTDDLSTTTWNISKTGANWNTAGCKAGGALTEDSTIDYYSTAVATQTGLTATGWTAVNVTDWVKELALESISGYGFILASSAPSGVNNNVSILSCDGADSGRPYIEVEYI